MVDFEGANIRLLYIICKYLFCFFINIQNNPYKTLKSIVTHHGKTPTHANPTEYPANNCIDVCAFNCNLAEETKAPHIIIATYSHNKFSYCTQLMYITAPNNPPIPVV